MRLIPTDGVLGQLLDVLDQPGGVEGVRLAIYEGLTDDLETHRHIVDRVVSKVWSGRIEEAKRGLLRSYVSKRMDGEEPEGYDVAAAQLTAMEAYVAKADPARRRKFRESDVRRDPAGRFGHKVNLVDQHGNPTGRPISYARSAKDEKLLTPEHVEGIDNDDADQHTAMLNHVKAVLSQFDSIGAQDAVVEVGTPKGVKERRVSSKDSHPEVWSAQRGEIPISIRPDLSSVSPQRLAAFDAMSTFTDQSTALRQSGRVPKDMSRDKAATWADRWTAPSDPGSYDRQVYNRLAVGGQALSTMGGLHPAAAHAGAVAQVVGTYGPEAERVLGPGLRRTLYRYRGTERRPDQVLRNQIKGLPKQSSDGRPLDQRVVDSMRRDVAVRYLAESLPNPRLTELSISAGKVPPSQGVLIDSHGDVVSESMGAAGDHYLPFNLKNLGMMHGGQYVRTRASGGPTSEDIYTGLLSGVRNLTVVSNSGVFTIDFDPDLRGGRRYSDKAKAMVGRYEKLLDAVQSEKLDVKPLSREKVRELRQRALDSAGGDTKTFQDTLDRLTKEARLVGRNSFKTERELDEDADAEAMHTAQIDRVSQQDYPRLRQQIHARLKAEQEKESVESLRLDGKGYAWAMKALQEEFPYYIRNVAIIPIPDFYRDRNMPAPKGYAGSHNAVDRGYTLPGTTDAYASQAGYHHAALKQKKVSAAQRDLPRGGAKEPEEDGETPRASARLGLAPAGAARPGGVGTGSGSSRTLSEALANTNAIKPLLRENAQHLLNSLSNADTGVTLTGDKDTAETSIGELPGRYSAQGLIDHYSGSGGVDRLAEKLANPATADRYRMAVTKTAEWYATLGASDLSNPDEVDADKRRMAQAAATIAAAADLADPFAREGDQLTSRSKPLLIQAVDALGSKRSDFQVDRLAGSGVNVPAVKKVLAQVNTVGDDRDSTFKTLIDASIATIESAQSHDEYEDFKQDQWGGGAPSASEWRAIRENPTSSETMTTLGAQQIAWSFDKAQRVAEAREVLLRGGGSDPKEVGKADRQRVAFLLQPDRPPAGLLAQALAARS